MSTTQTSAFLTTTEVAEKLRLSRQTVGRLIRDRELPAVRIRGSIRVRSRDLDEFIDRAATRP
ncbi:MAG TPA: helix-turn-helix domain-containing protein [Gaiellaceae bacterium]|jgi:excisionase family DNA binding protein